MTTMANSVCAQVQALGLELDEMVGERRRSIQLAFVNQQWVATWGPRVTVSGRSPLRGEADDVSDAIDALRGALADEIDRLNEQALVVRYDARVARRAAE